jgi:hypothetical protein
VTDPELVHRAEQAYLGAVLARHGQTGIGAVVAGDAGPSTGMHTGDFTDPVHQAIYAALTGQPGSTRPDGPSGWLGRLRDLLERLLSSRARHAAAYLAELPALCPDPANLPAYAAMISEASQDRTEQARARQAEQAASEDPTLASAGTWLDNTGNAIHPVGRRRQSQASPGADPGTGPEPAAQASAPGAPSPRLDEATVGLAPDAARLARALRMDARRATHPDPAQAPRSEQSADRRASAADPVLPIGAQSAALKPEDLEDRVLASLMKHPAEGRAVIEWLPDEAFSTAPLRDLYNLIRHRLASGRPVDPLIIAWDASRLPDLSFSEEYGGSAFLTQVALQVGALDPAPGTAEILGRALHAERILSNTLGENWPTDPELARRLTALAPDDPTHQPVSGEAGPAAVPEAVGAGAKAASTAIAEQPAAAQRPATAPPASAQQVAPQLLPLLQPPAPDPSGPALRM